MAKIFTILGKSATGKDTVYKKILDMKELSLKEIVMHTTRPRRNDETNGKEYYFVDHDDLKCLLKQGKVIECRTYETVHGPWSYFTVNDENINLEKSNYLIIGTIEAFTQFKDYFGEEKVIPIYIEVDDDIRLIRAIEREKKQEIPSYTEVCRRFLADAEDFSEINIERAGIQKRYNNNSLEECIKEIYFDIKNLL